MNHKTINNQSGLSLIETLFSFIILSAVLFAIIQVFPTGLKISTLAKSKTQAVFLAQAKIEEIFSQNYDQTITGVANEASLATIDADFSNYSRSTEISLVDSSFNPSLVDVGLKKISVTVSWNSFGHLRSVILNSLITE